MSVDYTIAVTTYSKRFDDFFVPLIKKLSKLKPNTEILVTVNGPVGVKFDQIYRKRILNFLVEYDNVYPRFYPQFASLSKLINECLVTSSNHHVLILNDDIDVHPIFFEQLDAALSNHTQDQLISFTINNSLSHMFLDRREVHQVGYFDERLIGLGMEDADFMVRYFKHFSRPLMSVEFSGIRNMYDVTYNDKYKEEGLLVREGGAPAHAQTKSKYSDANHHVFKILYPNWPEIESSVNNACLDGKFDNIKKAIADEQQYPYEPFSWENRKLLGEK